jgi:hypothetical protein
MALRTRAFNMTSMVYTAVCIRNDVDVYASGPEEVIRHIVQTGHVEHSDRNQCESTRFVYQNASDSHCAAILERERYHHATPSGTVHETVRVDVSPLVKLLNTGGWDCITKLTSNEIQNGCNMCVPNIKTMYFQKTG